MSIESIVALVREAISSEQCVADLVKLLKTDLQNTVRGHVELDQCFVVLSQQQHLSVTLALALVLEQKSGGSVAYDRPLFHRQCLYVFSLCDGAIIPSVLKSVLTIAHMFALSMVQLPNSDLESALSLLLRLWQTIQTLLPAVTAPVHVQLISNTSSEIVQSELTSLSSDLFLLALKTKSFHVISPVLAAPVLSVRPDETGVKAIDNLLHHYYGGIILCAQKQYQRAFEFFLIVLTAPSRILSAVQIEAFKKYTLVSLILFGEMRELPRYTSHTVLMHVSQFSSAYHSLVQSMTATASRADLEAVIAEHAAEFTQDRNFGLVQLALKAHTKRTLKSATATHCSISVSALSSLCGLAVAETSELLTSMIECGELNATLQNELVRFLPPSVDLAASTASLEQRMLYCQQLSAAMKTLSDHLDLHPALIQKSLQSAVANDTESVMQIGPNY